MSVKATLLVDGNSLGYVCHCRSSYVQSAPNGEQVQSLEGFYERLWALYRQYPDFKLTILWDDQLPWRNVEFPQYKQNREQYEAQAEIRRQYKLALPLLKEMLGLTGARQLVAGSLEADDLAYLLTKNLAADEKVVLCSSDTDWWQLVSPQVSWQSCKSPYQTIALSNFCETGFDYPSQSLEAKILTGDKADNIPGFKDVGPARAKEILGRYGNLGALRFALKEGSFKADKWYEKSLQTAESVSVIDRNKMLMDLSQVPDSVVTENPIIELARCQEVDAEMVAKKASLLGLKNLAFKFAKSGAFFSWLSLHQNRAV